MVADDRQDNPDTQLTGAVNPSPGGLLREAREAAGLSLEALADRLHLHKATLQALEEDRFGDLPEPPYVRGYLRGCAKVLETDPTPLLEAFRASGQPAGPEEQQLPGPVQGRIQHPVGLRGLRPGLLWIAVLGGILVLAAAGAWSLVAGGGGDEDAPALGGAGRDTGREEIPAAREDTGSGAPSAAAGAVPQPLPAQASGTGGDAALTPVGTGGTGNAEDPGSEDPEAREDVRAGGDEEDAAEPEDGAGDPASGSEGDASTGAERLRLVFRQDCWVQITDADGEDLLSGLIRAGREHRLEGAGPIRVFLGNAPGVELFFNDRRVDTAGRARDDRTARFTLGAS